jgi:hypothetical protein
MRPIARALMWTMALLLSIIPLRNGSANDFDTVMSRLIVVHSSSAGDVYASWAETAIPYTVVGNLSNSVNGHIDALLSKISKVISKEIKRSRTALMFMIFDSDAIDDVNHNSERFRLAAIPVEMVVGLQAALHGSPDKECVGYERLDPYGNIIGFVLASKSVDISCVDRFIYYALGLSDPNDAHEDRGEAICVLYRSRAAGQRSRAELTKSFEQYLSECKDKSSQSP